MTVSLAHICAVIQLELARVSVLDAWDPFMEPYPVFRIIPAAPPATPAMRLKDLQTGLRGFLEIAVRDASDTWSKGPGHYVGVRDALQELVVAIREHDRRIGEVTEMMEGSSDGVLVHEDVATGRAKRA